MNKNTLPTDIIKLFLSTYNSMLDLNMRMNGYTRRMQRGWTKTYTCTCLQVMRKSV